jgi:hypothetical protein
MRLLLRVEAARVIILFRVLPGRTQPSYARLPTAAAVIDQIGAVLECQCKTGAFGLAWIANELLPLETYSNLRLSTA